MARRELAELPARMGYAEASLDPEEMFYLIGLTKERRAVYWVSRLCRPTPSKYGARYDVPLFRFEASVHRHGNDHVCVGGAVRSVAAVAFSKRVNGYRVAARGCAVIVGWSYLCAAVATTAPGCSSRKNQCSQQTAGIKACTGSPARHRPHNDKYEKPSH